VIIGMVLSLYAARLLRTLLFGVTAHDPMTFAVVALLLLAVGAAASYVPSRRATRIDPLEALRGG
jgi:putative ABC transport system permease protein